MPFVAVSIVVLIGSIGISTDLMRYVEAAHQLQYAAQVAAIYGLGQATNQDGSYDAGTAQSTNIPNAIQLAGGAAWNQAQSGPSGNTWSSPVSFSDPGAIQFAKNPNPQDPTDFFVQVSAGRTSADNNQLISYFLPVFQTSFQSNTPGSLGANNLTKTVEVVLQPASRVGAGALASAAGSNTNFVGCGSFPIAISNLQFASIAQAPQSAATYTLDFVSSLSPTPTPGHLSACFVNVAPSGNTGNYYGTSSSASDAAQLQGLLNYFASPNQLPAPAAVERGSMLSAFDPANKNVANVRAQLVTKLQSIIAAHPTGYFIVPVLSANPQFGGSSTVNKVVGFSRLRLISAQSTTNSVTVQVQFGESVAMRDATCAEGFSVTNSGAQTVLPAPVVPFLPRTVDNGTQSLAARPFGVVMAPAISPRNMRVVLNLPAVQ